jgi:hypothetical protein
MYIDNPYRNPEPINDHQDMDADDDEECNLGDDAEEIVEQCNNKKPGTMSPKKCMIGYDRHFRSSTTKSGASSNGQFKQSSGPATRHGMSTEDDDDNFLTLECDENLYDERLNAHMYEEEEKVVINSKITKHMPTDKNIKRHQSKEKRIIAEKVDDTLPNFGFVEEVVLAKPVSKPKIKVQKEAAKNKVVQYLKKTKTSSSKNPKKLKIKLGKSKKVNENQNPFLNLGINSDSVKEHMLVEEIEDVELQLDMVVGQPIPEILLYDSSNNDHMQGSDNFMFNPLQCTDDMDDFEFEKESNHESLANNDVFINQPYDNYYDFNSGYEGYSQEMNIKTEEIDDKKEEEEAASKMLNHLIMSEGQYAPDPNYFDTNQNEVSSIMRAILVDWMMEVCNEFTLKRETFHYSLNYVDRFLSIHKNVKKEELQLVGVSCMFIAAKMEEVYSPRVADFAKSTDNGYDVTQIVKMEKVIIRELQWRTTPPTY